MKYLHGQSIEMEKTHCNLKFDRHTHTFVSLLDYFRTKELYCDATIACDGGKYRVHQVVLSACSDFFGKIFASISCQNPMVVLQDISRSHLESLLTYIYRGEVHVPHHELSDFFKVAKSLYIKGLVVPQCEIPHPEKHQLPEPISGSWHKPYYAPEEETDILHTTKPHMDYRSRVPMKPQMQRREDMTHLPSYHSHMQLNDSRVEENPLKRQRVLTHQEYYAKHDERDYKRPHYMVELPQDLRVPELPHQRYNTNNNDNNNDNLERSHTRWEEEEATRCTRDVSPRDRRRSRSSEMAEQRKDESSATINYSRSNSQGTFQELVVADETPIKTEPEDSVIECDTKPPSLLEDAEDSSQGYDREEAPLQISEEQNDTPVSPVSDLRSNEQLESSNNQLKYSSSPEPASRSDTSASLQHQHHHLTPTSQLRRELLRHGSLQVTHGIMQHPQTSPQSMPQSIPQSIPHPVIASRQPQSYLKSVPQLQPPLRNPPPLVKIQPKMPTMMNERDSSRLASRKVMKDMPVNRSNSHLLVTAPPTYRSHSTSSNNFSFEIHNQQLGNVIVNGGTHISMPTPLFSQPKPQLQHNDNNNEGPLNLSGGQRSSPDTSDEPGNGDPFLGKIVTNRKKRLRGPKSWEFLVRLLKDPTTNPKLIRWESENDGIFRLVEPSTIAQRWGRRTGKHASECLTYENFARGLRYHYATGALKPVSEKSFVYKFGPKALKLLHDCDSTAFPYI